MRFETPVAHDNDASVDVEALAFELRTLRSQLRRLVRLLAIVIAVVVAFVTVIIAVAGVGYIRPYLPDFAPSMANSPSVESIPQPDTMFYRHIKQAGLLSCENTFPRLGELLVAGSKYALRTEWDKSDSESRAIQTIVGMNYDSQAFRGAAAGVIFSSPNGHACSGNMVRVAPYPGRCDKVTASFPDGSQQVAKLSDIPVYALSNDGGQVMLLQAADTCVVLSVVKANK